jgi:hypothetical protein
VGEWALIDPEIGGRRVIRVIVSPLRIANADQQFIGQGSRNVGRA